ncbi:hypothetical protein BJ508DRAFT_378348 [Ascobolus immersus RN42]|uniref:F-box domain-containing protein n=1 Tax=Ascobolus immersus RN42 TaxID=1160509 RepID=A0A3N4HXC8_ASCIM|nr:hypothetical protein BJ508DRAFT_378348 [Ascobolus immersus RN42]
MTSISLPPSFQTENIMLSESAHSHVSVFPALSSGNKISVSTSTGSFQFLALPTELRLEIYDHCSALALLALSHASVRLSAEINALPRTLSTSHGYATPPGATPHLTARNIAAVPSKKEAQLFNKTYAKQVPASYRSTRKVFCETCLVMAEEWITVYDIGIWNLEWKFNRLWVMNSGVAVIVVFGCAWLG